MGFFFSRLFFFLSIRHLGLDLVPRKEFEMVDPDQISVSELYKLVKITAHLSLFKYVSSSWTVKWW